MAPLSNNSAKTFPPISGYVLTERLYEGARTAVYRAVSENRKPVVIKVMQQSHPDFSELVHFRNQYAITKNLSIPGVVRSLNLEPWQNGYALVMEDFKGYSLQQYTAKQPLSLIEVLSIAIQMTDILHGLNQHHIVHKDIKPANILIQPESKRIQLIDFSIATRLPKETQEIQNPNVLEGTLAYLAPEQTGRMNRGIDYRTDFYGLGVTLYKLLTDQLPFSAADPLELVHCHIAKTPALAHEINSTIPSMVSQIVLKLMSKNGEDRYQSALGLKHDLVHCIQALKETGEIAEFELGQRDMSDRFLIPEKIYGREAEVKTLLKSFERTSQGKSEMMLVAGLSGIGKTAVVNEVHKPITRQQGYFIKGKFDQLNRNIPLSAFVQALRDLMEQLLSESDVQLMQWKSNILAALGKNGQVLIDVIPELEQIIGKQPNAPALSGNAAQNRFNRLFQKFIEVFTTAAHPLVVFLDDLQWADLASLQLMKLLMNDNGYLLILGAYRDNEVSLTHPFMMMLEELQKIGATVNTIALTPLTLSDTSRLVADTLHCSPQLAKPLIELVDRKTQGNPFFTTQFLRALHEDGHIRFNRDYGYWECNIAQVNALALTDNVVEFMVLQLQKLPTETQQVLKLAACIGNQFDLTALEIVSEQSSSDVSAALWKALKEGLILPTSQVYKFFQDVAPGDEQRGVNPTYRFLHDRVQQAAYALIPDHQKQQIHLTIGRLLWRNRSTSEYIFEILNHFNTSLELIDDPQEQRSIAKLNLAGCQRAKAAIAYDAAAQYAHTAISLLPTDAWVIEYALTLEIYEAAAEIAYLKTEFSASEALIQTILQQSNHVIDSVKSYDILICNYIAKDEQIRAIEIGLEALTKLEVPLIKQANWQEQLPSLPRFADLDSCTTMTQPEYLAALKILITITPPTHHVKPEIFPAVVLTMLSLCDRAGYSELAAYVYGIYGLLLCAVIGDLETAHRSGQLSLLLLEKYQARELRTKVNMLFAVFVCACKDAGQDTLPLLKQGIEVGLEVGDIEYVSYCIMANFTHLFLLGQPLDSIKTSQQQYLPILEQFKQEHCIEYSKIWLQITDDFTNSHESQHATTTKADRLGHFEQSNNHQCLFAFHLAQLISCYTFGQYERAVEHAMHALDSQDAAFGVLLTSAHTFYHSLALLAEMTTSSTPLQCQAEMETVLANQSKMQQLAEQAPSNYQHKWDLVAAEIHRVQGQKSAALDAYERAIDGAKANGYLQEAALAYELAAKFYLDWGKEIVAAAYMQQAYYGYVRWGAKAKIDNLVQRYPTLLQPILEQALKSTQSFNPLETVVASQLSIHPSIQVSRASTTSLNTSLDFATVLKASQSLSGTIKLEDLLHQLTQVILQNSGGDCCALILPSTDNVWQLKALATPGNTELLSEPLADHLKLPLKLIQYVKNTQATVVIDNLETELPVIDDYLEKSHPQSLLCLPLLNQGKFLGILYLRNQATCGAFTQERVHLLGFLCTQAAISLENARLYQQAQAYAEQAQTYAEQLEQSQLQTIQSEKMASLGNLVAGVAHEINNPIGFLNGSVKNAQSYLSEIFHHLSLYQSTYLEPDEIIQENAEDIDLDYIVDDFPKLLKSMTAANDRIKAISTSLRTFSRADTEHKVSANLQEGLDSTLLILKYRLKHNEQRPAIRVVQDYGQPPIIKCFPGQLNQVFMNLLANAIDIFDEAAEQSSFADLKENPQIITVKTEICTEKKIVNIRIGDNGKGMSEEVKARIFDHLFTTKGVGKGTGLGLAIAQQIVVEKHGGSLTVQSEIGQGTEFCIQLPL